MDKIVFIITKVKNIYNQKQKLNATEDNALLIHKDFFINFINFPPTIWQDPNIKNHD